MDLQTIKTFHAACYMAKRIVEFQPNLPANLSFRSIYTIEAVHSIAEKKERHGKVTAADVAQRLGVRKQTAARYIKELFKNKLVTKHTSEDGRHAYFNLTAKGEKYYEDYIISFEKNMAKLFGGISKNDMQVCISTIHQAFYLLANNFDEFAS